MEVPHCLELSPVLYKCLDCLVADCGGVAHDMWRSTNGYTSQLVWQNVEEEGTV